MAGPPFNRESRVWEWTPSAGATVEIKRYVSGALTPAEPAIGTTLDINLAIVVDTPLNQDTTNSGDNGGSSFTRVGGIWTYRMSLGFPAALVGGALAAAFVQQILDDRGGYIWIRFNMGDPEFWTGENRNIRSIVGRRSLLAEVEQRVEVGAKKVIGLNIAGQGSSLLRYMLRSTEESTDVQLHP